LKKAKKIKEKGEKLFGKKYTYLKSINFKKLEGKKEARYS